MNIISSREQAYTALFAKLQAIGVFKICTRRLQHFTQVAPEDHPVLFMEHSGEVVQPVRGLPARVVLEVNLYVYVRSDGEAVGPVLNPVMDAIDAAIAPKNDGDHTQTLGGLVHHCWVEGQTQIFEGDLGDEAIAIIPVKILVT